MKSAGVVEPNRWRGVRNMDFEEMLRPKICACGKEHSCEIKHVDIGADALYHTVLALDQKQL